MMFKENRYGWSNLESKSRWTPIFIGQENQHRQQEGAAREKRLRVGKCGAPEAQRRAHIQKEEVIKCYKK